MKWRVFTLGVAFSLLLSACTMEESESEVEIYSGWLHRLLSSLRTQ